jgi:dephospho-CoA kinase
MGNEMRRLYGGHILAKMAVEYLPRDKEMIIVDGIRNPGEVEFLRRQFGVNFVLVAVDAPAEKRFENISRRNDPRDPRTREEFDAMDARDQGAGEPPYGQQVAACMQIADHKILNDGTLEDLHNKLREVMKKIV